MSLDQIELGSQGLTVSEQGLGCMGMSEFYGERDVNVDDRDRAGRQGRRVRSSRGRDVWVKRLKGGSRAVLLVNRGSRRARLSASLRRVGMPQARHYRARDLWRHSSRKTGRVLRATVAPHGVAFFKVRAAR